MERGAAAYAHAPRARRGGSAQGVVRRAPQPPPRTCCLHHVTVQVDPARKDPQFRDLYHAVIPLRDVKERVPMMVGGPGGGGGGWAGAHHWRLGAGCVGLQRAAAPPSQHTCSEACRQAGAPSAELSTILFAPSGPHPARQLDGATHLVESAIIIEYLEAK